MHFQSIAVTNASVGITKPSGVNVAMITVEDAEIRYRVDGQPALDGHLAPTGAVIILETQGEIKNFRAIRAGVSNATIKVSLR